jgi:glutaryl-CoA dehydrogenase
MQMHAERSGNRWRLSGTKHWITNGGIADLAVVWARAGDAIEAFVVPSDATGFERSEIKGKLSLRASSTAVLYFDNVKVGDDCRLPNAHGLKSALKCLTKARFGIAWGALGAARACLAEAIAFIRERRSFGDSLAAKQLVQVRIADAVRRLTTAELLAFRLAELMNSGRGKAEQVSLAKWNNVRMALDIARSCRDLLGAAGITLEHAAGRHAQNLESVVTYEGTESIHQLIVGRAVTGESAF